MRFPGNKGERTEQASLLGEGGGGQVWSTQLGPEDPSTVALKVFDKPSSHADWARELRFAVRLRHAHIVPCHGPELDEDTSQLGLRFELAKGGTLRQALRQKREYEESEVITLLCQIGSALMYSHELGVVHRDVKPENILAMAELGRAPWSITDFGASLGAGEQKRQEEFVGTLEYAAPETLSGWVTPKSDLYALGVVGLEMLRGRRPTLEERSRLALNRLETSGLMIALGGAVAAAPSRRLPSLSWLLHLLREPSRWIQLGTRSEQSLLLSQARVIEDFVLGQAQVAFEDPHLVDVLAGDADTWVAACRRRVLRIEARSAGKGRASCVFAADHPFTTLGVDLDAQAWLISQGSELSWQIDGTQVLSKGAMPSELCDWIHRGETRAELVSNQSALFWRAGQRKLYWLDRAGDSTSWRETQVDAPPHACRHMRPGLRVMEFGDDRQSIFRTLTREGLGPAIWSSGRPLDAVDASTPRLCAEPRIQEPDYAP